MFNNGKNPSSDTADPVEWRGRTQNKVVDYLCNYTMNTSSSWQRTWPLLEAIDLNEFNILILGASRRPPTPNFRFFGPFSEFFVVGEGAGGSGDLFSCSGIDFSCSGVEFSCSESIFRAQRSIFDPGRSFFLSFRFVFVVGEGPGGSGNLFSCSGIDFSCPGLDFSYPGLDFHAGRRLGDTWGSCLVLF